MARTDTLGHFLTDVANAIRSKTGDSATITASDFDTAIENIPTGGGDEIPEKDVNYYDYDGTRLYSYTKSEFLSRFFHPSNPTHAGLTSQGWNWTIANAKTYVQNYGCLNIGQNYITNDNSTRFYIELEENDNLTLKLGFCINGTATIDWGDNSQTETVTGTSATTPKYTTHTYLQAGNYKISLLPSNTNQFISLIGGVTSSYIFDLEHIHILKKAELGNTSLEGYSFNYCYNLETITIPTSLKNNGRLKGYEFAYAKKLKCYVAPYNYTYDLSSRTQQFAKCDQLIFIANQSMSTISQQCFNLTRFKNSFISLPTNTAVLGNAFDNASNLKKITGVGQANSYAFQYCYDLEELKFAVSGLTLIRGTFINYNFSLKELYIPSTVSTLSNSCFANCYALRKIYFINHTSVPTMGSSLGDNLPSDYKVIVPDSLYETWIATDLWANIADHIIRESDDI